MYQVGPIGKQSMGGRALSILLEVSLRTPEVEAPILNLNEHPPLSGHSWEGQDPGAPEVLSGGIAA